MTEEIKGKEQLIEGIQNDAQQEAEKVVSEAEHYADERHKATAKRIEGIIKEAEEKAADQAAQAERKIISGVESDIRRIKLRRRDRLISDALNKVRSEFEALIGQPKYRDVLKNWMVEGLIGIGAEKASVNASEKERGLLDTKLLKEAADEAGKYLGISVTLTLSEEPPLHTQGVVVTADDGKTAYNNQVQTRLLRYQSEIRKIVYEEISEERG